MHAEIEAVLRGESRWCVIEGDNADYREALPKSAAIVSDPPYGMNWDVDSVRFSGGNVRRGAGKSDYLTIHNDDKPFDPAPWLDFEKVVVWGSNHYAQRLPVGTTLVWVKRNDAAFGTFLSDAEIAWQKGGHGVYCFRVIRDFDDRGAHPTQKPVALMEWCIERLKLPEDSLVIDPYCGSGTTGVAAVQLGHRFIGIEREPQYCAIARRRIADAAAQGSLF